MKYLILLLFSSHLFCQNIYELKNNKLITYYNLINKGELKIVTNDLDSANVYYKQAFKENNLPHAKDLYNSLLVSLKINDKENAEKMFISLKCLDYTFEKGSEDKNFVNTNFIKNNCNNKIDYAYKKSLDSLFEIDQYYRNLSKGNYKKYQKELTLNDSIAATKLNELIQKKGFPNEYNIGLSSSNQSMYLKFYFIIFHQNTKNLYSPQRINFSDQISKALNEGKIRPDIAAQLLELNNGNLDFTSFHFKIFSFSDTIKNSNNEEEEKVDCCYISKYTIKENRNPKFDMSIAEINSRRKKIGLCSLEDETKKIIYNLDKKEYIFTNHEVTRFNLEDENSKKSFKEPLIKIK